MQEQLLDLKQFIDCIIIKKRWKKRINELDFLLSTGDFIPLYEEEFEERIVIEVTFLLDLHILERIELQSYLFFSSSTEDTISIISEYDEEEFAFQTHGG